MNNNLKENINDAKKLLDNELKNLKLKSRKRKRIDTPEVSRTYLFTNEKIKNYLSLFNLDQSSNCLTILSSGDQVYNLVAKGVEKIDSFDINMFTEYYALGIKRSMILKYNYYQFINTYRKLISKTISSEEISELLLGLFPYMEEKHRIFWQEIVDHYQKLDNCVKTNYFILLFHKFEVFDIFLENNYYLDNELIYNYMREKLANININFKQFNVIDIDKNVDKIYDFINLSNILDYFDYFYGNDWNYDVLTVFKEKLKKISHVNSEVLLHYMFDFIRGNHEYLHPIIDNSTVQAYKLTNETLVRVPNSVKSKYNDGIIYIKE